MVRVTLSENCCHAEVHTPLSLAVHTLFQGPQLAAAPMALPLFALSPKSIPGATLAVIVCSQSPVGSYGLRPHINLVFAFLKCYLLGFFFFLEKLTFMYCKIQKL